MTKTENPDKKVAPLPLVIETKNKKSSKTLEFKLRVNPTVQDSPTYSVQMDVLDGTETPREVLNWLFNVRKAIRGLNAADVASIDAIVKQMLRGKCVGVYTSTCDTGRRKAHEEAMDLAEANMVNGQNVATVRGAVRVPALSEDMIWTAVRHVIASALPSKCLQKQKRCMRRFWRKPKDMNIRQCANNIQHINDVELPELPPFVTDQGLSEDEIVDMIIFGVPNSWSKEMDKQGINPEDASLNTIINFFERMEESEDFDPNSTPVPKKKDKSGKPKALVSGKKDCVIHGPNRHPTEACHTIKNMIANQKGGDGKPKCGNKSWKRDGKDNKKKDSSKKDMAAFIKKTIKEEMNAVSKKRKSSDISDEDAEMNAVDEIGKQLADFNYTDDMSEGEVTV